MQHCHHVKHRHPAQVPLHLQLLHQPVERIYLVLEAPQHHPPHPLQQPVKTLLPLHPPPPPPPPAGRTDIPGARSPPAPPPAPAPATRQTPPPPSPPPARPAC